MTSKEKHVEIPKFSIKSAFLILISGIIGGLAIPYLFYTMKLDPKIAVIMFLPILISISITYGQCFIETNIGLGRRFYRTLIISFIILESFAYLWLFKGIIF